MSSLISSLRGSMTSIPASPRSDNQVPNFRNMMPKLKVLATQGNLTSRFSDSSSDFSTPIGEISNHDTILTRRLSASSHSFQSQSGVPKTSPRPIDEPQSMPWRTSADCSTKQNRLETGPSDPSEPLYGDPSSYGVRPFCISPRNDAYAMPFGMGLRCEVQDSLAINNRNIGAQVPSPTVSEIYFVEHGEWPDNHRNHSTLGDTNDVETLVRSTSVNSPAKQSRRASGRGQPLSSVLSEEASRSPSSASAAASTGRRSAISSKLHSRLDKWKSRMRSISRTLTLRRGQSGLTHVSGAEAELYGGQNEYADRLKLERFERSLAAENMYRTDQAPTYGSSLNDIHIESGDLSEGGTIFDKIKYGSSPSDADVRSQIDELANSETPLSHSDSSRLLSLKDQLGTIESVKNAF